MSTYKNGFSKQTEEGLYWDFQSYKILYISSVTETKKINAHYIDSN